MWCDTTLSTSQRNPRCCLQSINMLLCYVICTDGLTIIQQVFRVHVEDRAVILSPEIELLTLTASKGDRAMSAKNSADAEPARKMMVWYLATSSSPAMSAYVLQHSSRIAWPMINQMPGPPKFVLHYMLRSCWHVAVEAAISLHFLDNQDVTVEQARLPRQTMGYEFHEAANKNTGRTQGSLPRASLGNRRNENHVFLCLRGESFTHFLKYSYKPNLKAPCAE